MNTFYRCIVASAAVLCTTFVSADPLMQIYCGACRSTEHSVDFGNFALNQMYGPEAWTLQDEVIIKNPEGGWVHVDLSFQLSENIITSLISSFIGLDFGIPNGVIEITTTTDQIVNATYHVDLDIIDTLGALPVGETNISSGQNIDGGGGDSSGGGNTGGGGVGAGGAGTGSTGGGGGGNACTSAGDGEWTCVSY